MPPRMVLVAFALLLAGCGAPGAFHGPTSSTLSHASMSTTKPDPETSPSSTHNPENGECGPVIHAVWTEPGVHDRAVAAGQAVNPPTGGFPLPSLASRYGAANATYVAFTRGHGDPGKADELTLVYFQHELRAQYFEQGTTREDRRDAFLPFARTVEAVDEATLQSQADAFADNLREDGSYRIRLDGPFQIDALAGRVAAATEPQAFGTGYVILASDEAELNVGIETLGPLHANRMDVVEVSGPGTTRADAWAIANQTFDGFGWPRPDLSDAHVSIGVC